MLLDSFRFIKFRKDNNYTKMHITFSLQKLSNMDKYDTQLLQDIKMWMKIYEKVQFKNNNTT